MSTEFEFDGLRVKFKGRVRDDVFSIYCVLLLEIISIGKIDDDGKVFLVLKFLSFLIGPSVVLIFKRKKVNNICDMILVGWHWAG